MTYLLFKLLHIFKLSRILEEIFSEYMRDIRILWEFLGFKELPGKEVDNEKVIAESQGLGCLICTPAFVPMSRYMYTHPSKGLYDDDWNWFPGLITNKTSVNVISIKVASCAGLNLVTGTFMLSCYV
mgnify:CR=1 FL=1